MNGVPLTREPKLYFFPFSNNFLQKSTKKLLKWKSTVCLTRRTM